MRIVVEVDKKHFIDWATRSNSYIISHITDHFIRGTPLEGIIEKIFINKVNDYYNVEVFYANRRKFEFIIWEEEFKQLTYQQEFDKLVQGE
jgi:hypothetical protein